MIRDPSDGSVKPEARITVSEEASKLRAPILTPNPLASGLPFASTKPEQQARIEKSREWLEQYRKAARDVQRMNDKGEIPNG